MSGYTLGFCVHNMLMNMNERPQMAIAFHKKQACHRTRSFGSSHDRDAVLNAFDVRPNS